jgi:hypothetical protein
MGRAVVSLKMRLQALQMADASVMVATHEGDAVQLLEKHASVIRIR